MELAKNTKAEFDKSGNDLLEQTVKHDIENAVTPEMNSMTVITEDDDEEEVFVMSDDVSPIQESTNVRNTKSGGPKFVINNNNSSTSVAADSKIEERKEYVRTLLREYGMTVAEAEEAANKRFSPENQAANKEPDTQPASEPKSEEPYIVTIKAQDKDVEKIEFTDAVKEKLVKADAVKLVAVKDDSLKTIKFSKYKRLDKVNILRRVEKSIARYSVPLPALGDFAEFKGAQTSVLRGLALERDENGKITDSFYNIIRKQASILYGCFMGSASISKFDDRGNASLSYAEFVNKYRFLDIDMGLYGIFVASSREDITSEFTCVRTQCQTTYKDHYNIKALLDPNSFDDKYKKRIDDILTNRNNVSYLTNLAEDSCKITRFMSNETGNIYDIETPSLGKALTIYSQIDETDNVMNDVASYLLFISCIGIKNGDEYIAFGYDEEIEKELEANPDLALTKYADYKPISELFDIFQRLPQYEIDLITQQVRDYSFRARFRITTRCSACGYERTIPLGTNDMLFLTLPGSTYQIEQ